MATSLLALLDDITSILDDVAAMSKIAAKKTVGVLGDDLALNANQVSGVHSSRELPVVWSVAKGSFINKCILVPLALLISALAHWLIAPLLMIGGAYLCFEGFEKVLHSFAKSKHGLKTEAEHHSTDYLLANANATATDVDLVVLEKSKVKGAIRTDFILSAEIVVISLGTVASSSLLVQIFSLSLISIVFTVGVYGLVAVIVKLDDLGFHLLKQQSKSAKSLGAILLAFAPKLMKTLTIVGTIAMFLVGGGIFLHNVPAMAHIYEAWLAIITTFPAAGLFKFMLGLVVNLSLGLFIGGLCFAVFKAGITIKSKFNP